jgi:sulfur transfer protein SufE
MTKVAGCRERFYLRIKVTEDSNAKTFRYEAQTAIFKDPVRTAQ